MNPLEKPLITGEEEIGERQVKKKSKRLRYVRQIEILKSHSQELEPEVQAIIFKLEAGKKITRPEQSTIDRTLNKFCKERFGVPSQEYSASEKKRIRERAKQKYIEQIENSSVYQFIKNTAERLKLEGVPLEDDTRINVESAVAIYSEKEVADDKRKFGYVQRIACFRTEHVIAGEKMELLKTALFNKFLGQEFITVRTSLYDDFLNGVDNLILERKTGNLVCMFDEAVYKKVIFRQKYRKIRKINSKGGASLKYGLSFNPDTAKISPTAVENIPVFGLFLRRDKMEECFNKFVNSSGESSDNEKETLNLLIDSLDPQIKLLKQQNFDEFPLLRQRLKSFEEVYKKIRENRI